MTVCIQSLGSTASVGLQFFFRPANHTNEREKVRAGLVLFFDSFDWRLLAGFRGLQRLEQEVDIDIPFFRMRKAARQRAHDFHSESLPKFYRRFVSRDHKIELHRAETK